MTRISTKILGVIVFILVPSLAFAQYGRETVARIDKSGIQTSQPGPWLGSRANGSTTPSGGESDANAITAPSSKPPIAFRGQPPR